MEPSKLNRLLQYDYEQWERESYEEVEEYSEDDSEEYNRD